MHDVDLNDMRHHRLLRAATPSRRAWGRSLTRARGHLSGAHGAFLARWLRLVDLEEGDPSARRAEIWAMPGVLGAARLLLSCM